MSTRKQVITRLADLIVAVEWPNGVQPHPVRVAIDGVDASGKTILADELIPVIEARGRPVIRASVDSFHNPQEVRYRQGEDSPEGYYRDSFNHEAILQKLLIPLGSDGDRKYRQAVFDYKVDTPLLDPAREAPVDAVLLFDGVFLLGPELINHWDFTIFVDVDFDVSVPRAMSRDVARSNGHLTPQTTLAKYNQRYVPGQKIYLAEVFPREKADVVFNNNDLDNPRLIVS
jgi:uridine kinase